MAEAYSPPRSIPAHADRGPRPHDGVGVVCVNDGKELSKAFLSDIAKRHSTIIGMTRSGKTYLCKHILEELHNMNVHTVFYDPKHDDDYSSLGTICTTPMQFYAQLIAKNPRIVYRPPGTKEGRQKDLTEIIDLIFNAQKNKKFKNIKRVIAIDEIQLMVKKVDTMVLKNCGLSVQVKVL